MLSPENKSHTILCFHKKPITLRPYLTIACAIRILCHRLPQYYSSVPHNTILQRHTILCLNSKQLILVTGKSIV